MTAVRGARLVAILVGVVLSATLGPPNTAVAQDSSPGAEPSDGVVIADGHVDIGPRIVDGEFRIQVRDDTVEPVVWRDLADVVLHAVDGAIVEVPDDERLNFLGEPGSDLWLLPQAQVAGILWPGWNTQDASIADVVDGQVTWSLAAVDGPGQFLLFLTGSFGEPTILFDSSAPLPQEMHIDLGTHVHGNWGFTAPGVYRLDVEMVARSGGDELMDRQTLTVAVGDVDPMTAFVSSSPAPEPEIEEPARDPEPAPGSSVPVVPIAVAAGGVAVAGIGLAMWRRRRRAA